MVLIAMAWEPSYIFKFIYLAAHSEVAPTLSILQQRTHKVWERFLVLAGVFRLLQECEWGLDAL